MKKNRLFFIFASIAFALLAGCDTYKPPIYANTLAEPIVVDETIEDLYTGKRVRRQYLLRPKTCTANLISGISLTHFTVSTTNNITFAEYDRVSGLKTANGEEPEAWIIGTNGLSVTTMKDFFENREAILK